MHVLLIGGTGNISTDCAALLARQGHEVSVVTRGKSPVPEGYRRIVADRTDADAMKSALAGVDPDVVIDFLAFVPEELKIDAEVFGGRVKQLIFISSTTVHRKPHPVPVTEDTPLGNEWSEYAQKKQACEEWLAANGAEYELPYTIVRPSHTYSPSWFPNCVSSAGYTFPSRLEARKPVFVPDDGQALWTLTTTTDFAVGLAGLSGNERALGESFIITADAALTWNQIYSETARALGVDDPVIVKIPTEFACGVDERLVGKLKGDKAHSAIFDNSKIKRFVPEFNCRDGFREGIARSVEWFNARPDRKVADPGVDAIWDGVITAWQNR